MKRQFFRSFFLMQLLCLANVSIFAQNAPNTSLIEEMTFYELSIKSLRGSGKSPSSEVDAKQPLINLSPERIWSLAESADLLAEGFPSFDRHCALASLCEVIQSHPEKSKFIDLMLPKIASISLLTKEGHKPRDWNEIAIVGNGGLAGTLILSVTKLAQKVDCPKIIKAIVSTNDLDKIAKFREVIAYSPNKLEFERLLAQTNPLNGANDHGTPKSQPITTADAAPTPLNPKLTSEAEAAKTEIKHENRWTGVYSVGLTVVGGLIAWGIWRMGSKLKQ